MKNKVLFIAFSWIFLHFPAFTQSDYDNEQTGLAGDHFSLEGALDLFKKSQSPEEFEKLLNTEDNHVHNLDLNEDGDIDYIRVHAIQDDDVHVFVLQVPVSDNENQDIAVLQLEKTGKEEAQLQIIGDEEIFGEEIIVEPSDEKEDALKNSKGGESIAAIDDDYVVVNVWSWPSVRFVYTPTYRPWISPLRWRVYPSWWKPWRPLTWSVWRPLKIRYYRPGYRIVNTHRCVKARTVYKPVRVTSVSVNKKYATPRANYKVSKTKTKVTGPRGKSVTKKTTKVNKNGKTKAQKTTIRKSRRGGN